MEPKKMSYMSETRIVLLDRQPLLRAGIAVALESMPSWNIVGSYATLAEARRACIERPPTLLLCGMRFADGSGLELIEELTALLPELKVLVYSAGDERLFGERAIRAGAMGYLEKSCGSSELVASVKQVLEGRVALSPVLSSLLVRRLGTGERRGAASLAGADDRAAALFELSDRELAIFEMIGRGLSSKAIGSALGISHRTVDTHRHRIRKKLGLNGGELTMSAALARGAENAPF